MNATVRQNAASPPLNFHGKQPTMSRLFWSSGASISPPRFSMWMQSLGNSALWVSWYAESGNILSTAALPPNFCSALARTLSHWPWAPFPRKRPIGRFIGWSVDTQSTPHTWIFFSNSHGTRSGCARSEEHTSELQSHSDLVCRLLLEKKKKVNEHTATTS